MRDAVGHVRDSCRLHRIFADSGVELAQTIAGKNPKLTLRLTRIFAGLGFGRIESYKPRQIPASFPRHFPNRIVPLLIIILNLLIVIDYLVGAPRFELGTPSPPDWCANRAALRSAEEVTRQCGTFWQSARRVAGEREGRTRPECGRAASLRRLIL